MRTKALLLVSGGYDSHVISALCSELNYDCKYMFFNYGQKSFKKERDAMYKIADNYSGCEDFHVLKHIEQVEIKIPWAINLEKTNYYPWRNLIFLSYALSYAEANKYNMIVTGINSAGEYPDTSREFVSQMEKMCQSVGIKLWTPLQELGKGDVYELGTKLGVELKNTWSCDYSNDIPCGKCGSCLDIKSGIEEGYLPKQDFNFFE